MRSHVVRSCVSASVGLSLLLLLARRRARDRAGGLGLTSGVHRVATQRAVDVMQVFSDYEAIMGSTISGRRTARRRRALLPRVLQRQLRARLGARRFHDELRRVRRPHGHAQPLLDLRRGPARDAPRASWGSTTRGRSRAGSGWRRSCSTRTALSDQAYSRLGHVLHLVEDMGQPAHTNSDLHGPTNRRLARGVGRLSTSSSRCTRGPTRPSHRPARSSSRRSRR